MIDFSDVAGLLPHSGKMVLLDRIVDFDEDNLSLIAELTVRDDGLFGNGHYMPSWAGIEYMAQAVGAYAGIRSLLAGEPIKLGYLLGTRRYTSNVPHFKLDDVLTVQIKNLIQDDKLGVFECAIKGSDIEVTANLNVYQPPSGKAIDS